MDGSEDEKVKIEKVKIPQSLIRNSGRMVPIMRYSRIADISWTFGRCRWCLGGEGCFLHCGRQTQRFSSIGGVQERDLRIWHQVVECCPLLASRRTVSDRKWENSTTSGERLVAAAHRKHWNVEEFEVLRSKSGVQSPSTVHQTGDAKNVRSRAFPSKDAPNPIPSLPFKAISGDPYKPCWGQLRRRAVSSGHSC